MPPPAHHNQFWNSHNQYRSETYLRELPYLREIAYCDVLKRQMTSWLTLSGDVRQKLTFKENSSIFARMQYFRTVDQNNVLTQQDADHVAGDRMRTLMSRMETRASSLIIFSYL